MTIKTTTSHNLIFSVEAFWNEEGGMGHEQYGKDVKELTEALHLLELARVAQSAYDWAIVCRVETKVS